MANPFLATEPKDTETAIMLEQAVIHDIGNAVAYTDGDKIFVNTDDNLFNILPAYDHNFLKWLLWHERFHKELRHHHRFFRYLKELDETETKDKFQVTKEEVNIIMDILVHDSLSKIFPELVPVAVANLAQMRNQNSLKYTFTTDTLEKMLDEYALHKKDEDKDRSAGSEHKDEDSESKDEDSESKDDKSKEKSEDKEDKSKGKEKGHGEGSTGDDKDKAEDGKPEIKEDAPEPDRHDETDWDKLKDIDTKEFITFEESNKIKEAVAKLKEKKLRLGKLTETLNSLVTSTRKRTYSKPCSIKLPGKAILKGSTPGQVKLKLCFDASGSMSREMNTFKEIISKTIPQALNTPTAWFAGENSPIKPYKKERGDGYYEGKFTDFIPVDANMGFNDDGDRTIELCWQAEQAGFTPIGVTDGGGELGWSKKYLKQLKRTILVGQNRYWLEEAKKVNPKVQILDV